MEFRPGIFAKLFVASSKWAISIDDDHVEILSPGVSRHPIRSISDIQVSSWFIWKTVTISVGDKVLRLGGFSSSKANIFRYMVIGKLSGMVLDDFYFQDKYLANRDVDACINKIAPRATCIETIDTHDRFLKDIDPETRRGIARLQDLAVLNRQELNDRNEQFIDSESQKWKSFFDTVENRPLTDEQRRAAIVMEDRNLLIAAAGSGKSSTVVAKIGYSLVKKQCLPEQILAIAFNRSAALELGERINKRLVDVCDKEKISSRTFHRFGMDIIASVEGKQPDLAPWASETRGGEGKIIDEIVKELSETDREFLDKWVFFQTINYRPNKELNRFETIQDYYRYLRQVGDEKDGRKGIWTLNGELVKSMEEVAIANWLFINGVPYEYERSYEYQTADHTHRQYHPDFYFPDIECYYEHFALDDEGRPPVIFSEHYAEGVLWKRMLHKEKKTVLLETTSAMYRAGHLFERLEAQLKELGQQLSPLPADEILKILAEQKLPSFNGFIRTFITLCKSRGKKPSDLIIIADSQKDKYRARAFLGVVGSIYDAYQLKLENLQCIDFEDMIRKAARYIWDGAFVHHYELILIDEFQDISHGRADLIKGMIEQNPSCKLFAVGDDWQSIYRFTGSDIELMTHFQNHFGVTATNYLTWTFRSNQGIADVAADFIQENPSQLKKQVRAVDKTTLGTIQILEYGKDEDVDDALVAELESISKKAKSERAVLRVFLLGRYNILRPGKLQDMQKQYVGLLSIEFLSLHRSKGLEADYVFILGVNSGPYSMPSEIVDDPLLDLILPLPEEHEHAEERRLFYVGLTRAKRRAYLLTKRSKISTFVGELLKPGMAGSVAYRSAKQIDSDCEAQLCPSCGTGVLRVVTGPYGRFMGCSNYPSCTEKRKLTPQHDQRL